MISDIKIPPHWQWATFGDVATVESDLVDPTLTPQAAHIAPNHIESWTGKLLPHATVQEDGVTSPKHRFFPGQVLYSKIRPYLAKAVLVQFEGVCSADMYPVRAHIDSRYLLHWLLTPWFTGEASRNQGRTILPKINRDALNRLHVPVAPLGEQQRIGLIIDELFSELDAGVTALNRVRGNLKRYSSAVLKAAVEGRLTKRWRAEHRATETGAHLLEGILKARRRRWEEEQLAAFATAKKDPPKNWQAKYKEPAAPELATLPKLPEGWCWATVEQVGDVQLGRQRSPEHHSGEHMRPYLRVANVFEDRLDLGDVLEMNFTPREFETYELRHGDILLNEGQSIELVGRPAMYRGELPGACFQNTLVRFRAYHGLLPEFALIVYRAYLRNRRFQKIAKWTVNIAHLGAERFALVEFPLPPLNEQQEIVDAVEQSFAALKVAEAEVARGLARSARLRQSILKQAFEGKLVARDPTDEPADVLLARIQQARTQVSPTAASASKKSAKLPQEVFMRRASVVSYTVRRLAIQRSFGRTQLEKAVHLTQSHLRVDLGFVFERYAAGPFDKAIYRLEGVARKNDWFTTQKRPKFGVTYHPGGKIDQMCEYACGHLGDRRADLDRLLDHIAEMNTDEAELFATAYAAWSDLLIDGRPADDEAIITEVHGWHEEKKKFAPEIIKDRLQWMRQNGYVPTGQGQRTRLAAKETKLHSRRRKKGDAST